MNKTKPENWRLSRQIGRDMHRRLFIEAICEHGIGHHNGVHGCDGCCSDMPKELEEQLSKD